MKNKIMEKLNKNKIQIEIDLNKIRVFSIFILFLVSLFVFYYSLSLGQSTQRYTVFRTDNSGFMFKKSDNTFAPVYAKGPYYVSFSSAENHFDHRVITVQTLSSLFSFSHREYSTFTYPLLNDLFRAYPNLNGLTNEIFEISISDQIGGRLFHGNLGKLIILGGFYYPIDRNVNQVGAGEGYYFFNLQQWRLRKCLTAIATPINLDANDGRDIVAHVVRCDSQGLGVFLSRPPRNDRPVHGFSWLVIGIGTIQQP